MKNLNHREQQLSDEMGFKGKFPPFIELLGVEFVNLADNGVCLKLAMRNELCLHPDGRSLHGGVISALMDIIGGSVVAWKIKGEMKDLPLEEQARKMHRVGTVDLRIDYLRPGKGKMFTATGNVLRIGRKVAVTRMELHNEEGLLIAVGSGTYSV